MFFTREKQLLSLLFKNQQKFTTAQIAAQLKVSPRTIKADIKRLNDELGKHSCSILTKQGVGIWLDYSEDGEQFLKSVLFEDRDSVYISPETRKYYLAAKLLLHHGFTSMESLANQFYVSKGTVVNDFNELEDFWTKFGLIFIKKVKYGICVKGTEKQIRLALTDALKRAASKNDRISQKRLQTVFEKTDLRLMKEILQRAEERFQYVLTGVSFDEFMLQLAVMCERLANGCAMEEIEEFQEDEENRRMSFVIHFIREQIEVQMDMAIPDSEKNYLKICMQGLRYHVPMIREKEKNKIRQRAPEMFDYMMELLQGIDERYFLELSEDEELACSLFDHLECMVYRIQSKMFTSNPILDSIKKEMFFEYEIASYFISKLSRKFEIEVTEEEIGYVAFHIGASIERMKQRKKRKFCVTIVCMTGIGTSQFVSMKLKRLFPELEIVRIISGNQAEGLKPETQDFVISTVPLNLDGIKVIYISSVLNEADVQKIQKCIEKKQNPEGTGASSFPFLSKYLHEEITILNCDLKSREEVLQLLGGRMVREGYADEGYVDSVLEREKLSETAVGSLVAIPHAFEGHIRKQGIGLLTLQKPILWGNEKVQIIFMLALSARTENNFQGIFGEVLEFTKDPKSIDQLLKTRKFSELELIQ